MNNKIENYMDNIKRESNEKLADNAFKTIVASLEELYKTLINASTKDERERIKYYLNKSHTILIEIRNFARNIQ